MLATHYTLHQDYGMSHPQSSYEARRVSVNLPRVNNRARHSFHSVSVGGRILSDVKYTNCYTSNNADIITNHSSGYKPQTLKTHDSVLSKHPHHPQK